MNKIKITLITFAAFIGLILAQDPPVGAPAFKEPVIKITGITAEQLAGIVARHKKDGPVGTDPLKWYFSRVEFELNLWASENVEQNKEAFGKDAEELLTEAEKKPFKDLVAKKKAAKEAKELAERLAREKAEKEAKEKAEREAAAKATPAPVTPPTPVTPPR